MNRPDFSNYVAHFTKNAPPLGAGEESGGEPLNGISGIAYERLISILQSKKIVATPMPWTNRKAVAFTECPFWSLMDHANRYSPYGVGFTKDHLFAAGGGPAIYLRPDCHKKQEEFTHNTKSNWHGFHPDLYAFVTPFVPSYAPARVKEEWDKPVVDYTHEREWRVAHDFTFELEQVQFVIVEAYEDMAKFPKELKDKIGRDRFILMEMYRKIEELWPTHRVD
jgi:hypothetical protein